MSFDEFIRIGLYDPEAPGATERRELLEHLLARGFAAEDLVSLWQGGLPPMYIAARLTRPWRPGLSVRILAERVGLDPNEVVRLRQACGFPVQDLDAVDIPDFFEDIAATYQFGCAQFGPDATLALFRVAGLSAGRIVEALRSVFSSTAREASATELEISQRNEARIRVRPQLSLPSGT